MNTTTVAPVVGVDLAKNVFELAIADENWRITERARLSRSQFERWFVNRQVGLGFYPDSADTFTKTHNGSKECPCRSASVTALSTSGS